MLKPPGRRVRAGDLHEGGGVERRLRAEQREVLKQGANELFQRDLHRLSVLERFEDRGDLPRNPGGEFVKARNRHSFAVHRGGKPSANVVQDEEREDFCAVLREGVELAAQCVELVLTEIAGQEIKQPPNAVVSGHRRRGFPDG